MSEPLCSQDAAITAMRLTVFCEVADRRGFGRAASAMFLAPPSVTAHIQALERAWNVTLIDRSQRGAVLTEAGKVAYETSVIILKELAGLRRRLLQQAGSQERTIAATAFPAGFILPGALARMALRDSDVRVSVRVTTPEAAAEAVRKGEADIGVINTATQLVGLASTEVWRERVELVAHPAHPLAYRDAVTLADVGRYPFVVGPNRSVADTYLDRELMRVNGAPRKVAIEVGADNLEGIKQAAAAGAGLALLYRSAAQQEVDHGDLVFLNVTDSLDEEVFVVVRADPNGEHDFATVLADAIQCALV